MPGRKFSAGSGYRYGFNGKEDDNEVKGEGNQQDYGFRIYDPRLGKFLSVDPLTKKYPELTPYQFASNRSIDGIDLDGLEFKKFNANATGTIIFQKDRDRIIERQYQKAMKSDINVMEAETITEMNGYFKEKNKTYKTILFGGHGPWNVSALRMGKYTYKEKDISNYSIGLKQLGEYLEKNGVLILLACFQATPKYNEVIQNEKGNKIEINADGESLIKKLSKIVDRNVVGNQGETRTDGMFMGTTTTGIIHSDHSYAPMNNKYAGHWSLVTPTGQIKDIGNIILNANGSYTSTKECPEVVDRTNNKSPK